jgi:uncharacterized SAM-binding protein YcdF (DUF218 family)
LADSIDNTLLLAEKLWDYMTLNQPLRKSGCILVLGSHDLRVANYAARLYLERWAPWLLFSGGLGRLTRAIWDEPEAVKFGRIALEMGVPSECILLEERSTNTGQNILFSRRLLAEKGIEIESILLVQKPYMERRAYAAFKKLWPEMPVTVSSPPIPFADYPTAEIPMDDVINIMVGDLQRILLYPDLGYQIPQEIPRDIIVVYNSLIASGYTKRLIGTAAAPFTD